MGFLVNYNKNPGGKPFVFCNNTKVGYPYMLEIVTGLARGEIVTALREPQRKLITLLRNRSVDLKEGEKELAQLEEMLESTQDWGDW